MAVLGIDQSLSGTGLSHIDHQGKMIRQKILKTAKLRGVARLKTICDSVLEFCQETGERFVIAREGYSFGSKGRASFSLGELGGCIDLTLFKANMPELVDYYVFSPTVIKKYCLGSGAVKKDTQYLLKVYDVFGIHFLDDNQADAFLIAQTLLGMLNGRNTGNPEFFKSLSQAQKEALVSKSEGITQAKVKKMSHEEFATHVAESLKNCKGFEGSDGDDEQE